MWRLKSTPLPTARMMMTAGTVLSLMPNSWPTMLALMKLRRRKNRFRRKIELENHVYILYKEK